MRLMRQPMNHQRKKNASDVMEEEENDVMKEEEENDVMKVEEENVKIDATTATIDTTTANIDTTVAMETTILRIEACGDVLNDVLQQCEILSSSMTRVSMLEEVASMTTQEVASMAIVEAMASTEPTIPMEEVVSTEPTVPMEEVASTEPTVPMEEVASTEPTVPTEEVASTEPTVPVEEVTCEETVPVSSQELASIPEEEEVNPVQEEMNPVQEVNPVREEATPVSTPKMTRAKTFLVTPGQKTDTNVKTPKMVSVNPVERITPASRVKSARVPTPRVPVAKSASKVASSSKVALSSKVASASKVPSSVRTPKVASSMIPKTESVWNPESDFFSIIQSFDASFIQRDFQDAKISAISSSAIFCCPKATIRY